MNKSIFIILCKFCGNKISDSRLEDIRNYANYDYGSFSCFHCGYTNLIKEATIFTELSDYQLYKLKE